MSIHSSTTKPATAGVNVADNPNAVASQSSTIGPFVASNAIDGDPGTFSLTDNEVNSYWQDSLGSTYFLSSIDILFSNNFPPTFNSNFRVSVLNNGKETFGEDFYAGTGGFGGQPGGVPLDVNLPKGVYGDTIEIQFLGLSNVGFGYLSLADVQAFSIPGLSVQTGGGNDYVSLLNTSSGDNVGIDEGTGDDTLEVTGDALNLNSSVFADGGSGATPDTYVDTLLFDLDNHASSPAVPAIPNGSLSIFGGAFATLNYLSYEAIPGFNEPTASAGTYNIGEGSNVNLDAKISFPPTNSTLEYVSWDLNDDGAFGDASGVNTTVKWAQLEALGIGKAGSYPIAVEFVYNNFTATGYGTLTIQYKAPTIDLTNPGTGIVGQTYTIGFTATEIGQETITGWKITWPDGTVDNLPSDASTDTHVFTRTESGATVAVEVFDSHSTNSFAARTTGSITIKQDGGTLSAGGPYFVTPGGSLTLTATSIALPGTAKWEISGDNGFNDATAPFTTTDNTHYTSTVTLSWAQLQTILTTKGVVDDGPQTLTNVNVQVSDSFGTFKAPTTITILESPPTATFSGTDTTVGGVSSVSFTNPSSLSKEEQNAGFTYSFDFLDNGVFEQTNTTGIATVPSDITAHAGIYTIHGRITDAAQGYTDYTTQITVADVDPDVTVGPDQTVAPGTLVNLGPAQFNWPGYSTAGHPETFTATVDWGDGTTSPAQVTITSPSGQATVGTLAATHTFAPGKMYNVTVSVEDAYGDTGSKTFKVTVASPQVTVNVGPDETINEGDSVNLSEASFSDTAAPINHTVTVDWGDGMSVTLAPSAIAEPASSGDLGSVAASHAYGTDGKFPVTLTVSDGATGGTASKTFYVTVNNVVPIVNAGPDQTVGVGNPVSINATFSDPGFVVNGVGESYTASIDWGDGSMTTTGVVTTTPGGPGIPTTGTVTGTHTYHAPGDHTVTVSVFDSPTTFGTGTLTVHDPAPVLITTQQTISGVEGTPVNLPSLQFSYAGVSTTLSASIDWGDGQVTMGALVLNPNSPAGTTTGTLSGSHTYGAFGPYAIKVSISNAAGTSMTLPIQASIGNLAPTVAQLAPQVIVPNAVFLLTDAFNDPGFLDTHSAVIKWGDGTSTKFDSSTIITNANGSTTQALVEPTASSAGSITYGHIYTDDSSRTVTLTITDDGGLATTVTEVYAAQTTPTIALALPSSVDVRPVDFLHGDGDLGDAGSRTRRHGAVPDQRREFRAGCQRHERRSHERRDRHAGRGKRRDHRTLPGRHLRRPGDHDGNAGDRPGHLVCQCLEC